MTASADIHTLQRSKTRITLAANNGDEESPPCPKKTHPFGVVPPPSH